jgi:hypothetical protein
MFTVGRSDGTMGLLALMIKAQNGVLYLYLLAVNVLPAVPNKRACSHQKTAWLGL